MKKNKKKTLESEDNLQNHARLPNTKGSRRPSNENNQEFNNNNKNVKNNDNNDNNKNHNDINEKHKS